MCVCLFDNVCLVLGSKLSVACTVTVTRKLFACISSSDGLMVYACGRYVLLVSAILIKTLKSGGILCCHCLPC